MNKKLLLTSITTTALFLGAATPAHAYTMPEFGSCLNPQWSKTQENNGSNHGVVGVGTYAGVDSIYETNGNVLQCLCTPEGKGYQTNWLKAENMSKAEMQELESQGWIYVAYGEDWGLHKSKYMAKNTEYTCAECTPTPTPVSETPTPTEEAIETTEESETPVIGGLAPTGNTLAIYMAIMAGVAAVVTGLVLRKFSK